MKEEYVYLKNTVHKDQLRKLLQDCGYDVTPDTFRELKKNKDGYYSATVFKVDEGKAISISPLDAPDMTRPGVKPLYEVLGEKIITDVYIGASHPEDGGMAANGEYYITADINNQKDFFVDIINQRTLQQYRDSGRNDKEIAADYFRDYLINLYRSVTIDVDCGSRWTNGRETMYYAESMNEGPIYKDMDAFDEKEGICYISEHDYLQYQADGLLGQQKDISRYGVTHDEIVMYARERALRNPEQIARQCLQNCTWQSVFTELEEFHNNCEPEDILDLDEEIQDLYDLYNERNGHRPDYAEVLIEWKDDRLSGTAMIALNDKDLSEEVLFTCTDFDHFKRLASENNGEDFRVLEIIGYEGDYPQQIKEKEQPLEVQESEDMESLIAEAERTPYERIIYMDERVTMDELRAVLGSQGIKVEDRIPGLDLPLPLEPDGRHVAADYLRVYKGEVLDWTSEYDFRDTADEAEKNSIEPFSRIKEVMQQKEFDRITDVRIKRSPLQKSSMEFRITCKIDGHQMISKPLTPAEVEKLANGADKVRMAAEAYRHVLEQTGNLAQTRGRGR